MNKNNMLIIGLLSCLMLPLSSCGNENEGLTGINISYENVNTEVASWPHVFYAFDKSNCTAFQTTAIKKIKILIIAFYQLFLLILLLIDILKIIILISTKILPLLPIL